MLSMQCPSCLGELDRMIAGDIELDACKNGCGGVWFDRDELLKFDEPHEFPTHEIIELAKKKEHVKVDSTKQKKCPKCQNEVLVRQFLDIKNTLEMDQCWNCSGVWLDVGEINALRGQFKTMEERSKAVNAYVDSVLSETKASLKSNTEQQLKEYNQEAKGGLFALKKLLGLDDLYDGL